MAGPTLALETFGQNQNAFAPSAVFDTAFDSHGLLPLVRCLCVRSSREQSAEIFTHLALDVQAAPSQTLGLRTALDQFMMVAGFGPGDLAMLAHFKTLGNA